MVVKLVPVLHGGVVDLRRHAACVYERLRIAPDALACGGDLAGSLARRCTLAARDEKAELVLRAAQTLFERAAHGGRQPARMPVEAEHAAESLEPVRIG